MELYSDDYFMNEALKEAQKAYDAEEVPVGAVIVANNRIIARSFNYTEHLNDVTAHAEMQAITAAASAIGGKYLVDCTLYVTLEPCVMCAGALGWSQITRIVYGASDTRRGYSILNNNVLHPKTQVTRGVLEEPCAELLKRFFAARRG